MFVYVDSYMISESNKKETTGLWNYAIVVEIENIFSADW